MKEYDESQIIVVDDLVDEIEDVFNSDPNNEELRRINVRVDEVIAQLDAKKYFKRLG